MYQLLVFYPGEAMFFSTNHTASDVDDLRRVATWDCFRGHRTRIVDSTGVVVFEPPVRSLVYDPTAPDPAICTIITGER
jgi:hypothetical protein